MDLVTFKMYLEAIPVIKARNMLDQIKVVAFPNMKKENMDKVSKDLHKRAFPETYDKKDKSLTPEDLQRYLARGLSGR